VGRHREVSCEQETTFNFVPKRKKTKHTKNVYRENSDLTQSPHLQTGGSAVCSSFSAYRLDFVYCLVAGNSPRHGEKPTVSPSICTSKFEFPIAARPPASASVFGSHGVLCRLMQP
jgi:hypothetical protein